MSYTNTNMQEAINSLAYSSSVSVSYINDFIIRPLLFNKYDDFEGTEPYFQLMGIKENGTVEWSVSWELAISEIDKNRVRQFIREFNKQINDLPLNYYFGYNYIPKFEILKYYIKNGYIVIILYDITVKSIML